MVIFDRPTKSKKIDVELKDKQTNRKQTNRHRNSHFARSDFLWKPKTVQNAEQGNKIQPDQKVLKNKTTTQKPRKEKNKFDEDNTKLGLALKTWLENPNKNNN